MPFDPKSLKGDLFRSEFSDLMGMTSGETVLNPKGTGSEVHLTGPGQIGEEVFKFTIPQDRSGNTSPGAPHNGTHIKHGNS